MAIAKTSVETNSKLFAMEKEKIKNNYFDGLPVSTMHKIVFFIIMVAYFFEQMDNWNFGFIAPALIKSWGIGMKDIAKVGTYYFVGMTLGAFAGGIVSDYIGRRKTFLISIVIFSVASIANGFVNDITAFAITRGLTGFGVFCLMVTSQAYIAEVSPAESRGKWQGLVAGVGFCAVPVIALLCRIIIPLGPEAWRYIFYLGGVGLFGFLIALKYLKESPRWLVANGRVGEAESIVEEVTGYKVDLSEAAKNVQKKEKLTDTLIGLFTGNYIKRTILLLFVFTTTMPAAFIVANWTPTLIKMKGFSLDQSLLASTIISIGVPLGCYLSSLISDKGGRKIPLVIIFSLCAAFGIVYGHLDSFVMIVSVGLILNILNMAASFITFPYVAEQYPTKMRNTGTGFHNGMARLAVAAFQPVIPIIFAGYSFTGVFNIYALLYILPALAVLFWGIRTGGKSLEEIS